MLHRRGILRRFRRGETARGNHRAPHGSHRRIFLPARSSRAGGILPPPVRPINQAGASFRISAAFRSAM
jgi:hypothetical protein